MNIDKSKRYSKHWHLTAKFTRFLTAGRCANCLCSKRQNGRAMDVHHLFYGVPLLKYNIPISGLELPFIQLVPLCKNCHKLAHRKQNYKIEQSNEVWGNHATARFRRYIRLRMLNAMFCVWVLPVLVIVFVAQLLGG